MTEQVTEQQGTDPNGSTGLPGGVRPGLTVRTMGVDTKAIVSYLVSTHYSAAVLVPDALGVLENVEVAR